MKPEAQRIALLEWMGWQHFEEHFGRLYAVNLAKSTSDKLLVPPLTLDLMHEAEKTLKANPDQRGWESYVMTLDERLGSGDKIHATAAQRLEAFLRTIGKWVEE